MKSIIILSTLITAFMFTSCIKNDELNKLKHDLIFTSEQLQACQNQLSTYHNDSSSSTETKTELEEPTGPQYETVYAYHITTKLGSTVCYERNDSDDTDISCGMTFANCKDGYVYRCMIDVKYKIVEEQKLVE